MDTGAEASRANRFTYLPSCFANELVHRRLGVFCTVPTPVFWGKWYSLRPEASRATKFAYLPSCSANELVHRRLGVFCTVFASVYWGKWYILKRDARGNKAWITAWRPRARLSLLTKLAAPLMDWCIGVLVYFVQFLHRFMGGNGTF